MMAELGVDLSINEDENEVQVRKKLLKEKKMLRKKLKKLKRELKKLKKTEPEIQEPEVHPLKKTEPEIQEPEVHPLKNSVVLKEVFDYIETSCSRDSYDTLKNSRLVCKEWKDLVTPRLMIKSKISFCDSIEDSIKNFEHTNNVDYILNIMKMKNWNWKTLLIIEHKFPFDIEAMYNQLQSNAKKYIGLTLGSIYQQFFDETTLNPMLQNAINLQELNLYNVAFKPIAASSDLNQCLENTDKLNIKHLKVLVYLNNKWTDVISSTFQVLLRLEQLKSLSLYLSNGFNETKDGEGWKAFFSTVVSKDKAMFKNLNRLELLDFEADATTLDIVSKIELTNVKHLKIQVGLDSPYTSFVNLVGQNLETLNIIVVYFKDARRVNADIRFLSKLPNLKVFECSFSKFKDDYDNEGEILGIDMRTMSILLDFTADFFIKTMPALKHWKVTQCNFENFPSKFHNPKTFIWEPGNSFNDVNCGNGLCTHVQDLLKTEDEKLCNGCLEKLDFSCSFREPDLISGMAKKFGNLNDLSIWIKSTLLNEFFGKLILLDKLKLLKIRLTCNVEDFAIAINSNLPKFKRLKELILEKCSHQPENSPVRLEEYHIFNIDEAHRGISKCDSLNILSFKNMKIDAAELNKLRAELLKNKPNLALNVFFSCKSTNDDGCSGTIIPE